MKKVISAKKINRSGGGIAQYRTVDMGIGAAKILNELSLIKDIKNSKKNFFKSIPKKRKMISEDKKMLSSKK